MIDYLLKYASPADVDLPAGDGPCWLAGGMTIMPVEVVITEAEFTADGELVSPEVWAPGVWYVVASEAALIHPAIVPWAEAPGRVSPSFAGRAFPPG